MGAPAMLMCLMTHSRHAVDGIVNQHGMTISLVGVGFFDVPHGQTGVAPNAIELHPVLGLCVGENCDPTVN
jgi:hypothetical protein